MLFDTDCLGGCMVAVQDALPTEVLPVVKQIVLVHSAIHFLKDQGENLIP